LGHGLLTVPQRGNGGTDKLFLGAVNYAFAQAGN